MNTEYVVRSAALRTNREGLAAALRIDVRLPVHMTQATPSPTVPRSPGGRGTPRGSVMVDPTVSQWLRTHDWEALRLHRSALEVEFGDTRHTRAAQVTELARALVDAWWREWDEAARHLGLTHTRMHSRSTLVGDRVLVTDAPLPAETSIEVRLRKPIPGALGRKGPGRNALDDLVLSRDLEVSEALGCRIAGRGSVSRATDAVPPRPSGQRDRRRTGGRAYSRACARRPRPAHRGRDATWRPARRRDLIQQGQ